MKLYMTRIAQAALISSAAIISSSAFALASSNIGDSAPVSYTLNDNNQVAVYVYTTGGVPQELKSSTNAVSGAQVCSWSADTSGKQECVNPPTSATKCKVTEDSYSDKPQLACDTTQPQYQITIQDQNGHPLTDGLSLKDGRQLDLEVGPATSQGTPVQGTSRLIGQATQQLNIKYWLIGDSLYSNDGTPECSKPVGKPKPLQDGQIGLGTGGKEFITIPDNTPEVIRYTC